MQFALGFCVLSSFFLQSSARPSFVALVPNGNGVNGISALGHVNGMGGGATNAFGKAFAAAGHQWTTELCQADSDGDGATNGEELGDPCCSWSPSTGFNGASSSTSPSHPGVPNSFTTEQLASMTCEGETDLNPVATSSGSSSMASSQSASHSQASSFDSSSGSFDDVAVPNFQPNVSPDPRLDQMPSTPVTSSASDLKIAAIASYCFSIILTVAM
ncbi:Temptin [Phytophthora citrophthora]|uniref:Temptin n=1 Tax=Phytophthora citrophthora TaxID=4793 RepID=A0AAD9LPJ4_9STRA|nr:Temptin [Phytophthora citrophthora]